MCRYRLKLCSSGDGGIVPIAGDLLRQSGCPRSLRRSEVGLLEARTEMDVSLLENSFPIVHEAVGSSGFDDENVSGVCVADFIPCDET